VCRKVAVRHDATISKFSAAVAGISAEHQSKFKGSDKDQRCILHLFFPIFFFFPCGILQRQRQVKMDNRSLSST